MDNDNKKSYYAIILADVGYDDRLKPNAKLLYGEITALCNEKGYCQANNKYFMKLYNVKAEIISRWIDQLNNYGYIKVDILKDDGNQRKIYINMSHRYRGLLIKNQYLMSKKSNNNIVNNMDKKYTTKQLTAVYNLVASETRGA